MLVTSFVTCQENFNSSILISTCVYGVVMQLEKFKEILVGTARVLHASRKLS